MPHDNAAIARACYRAYAESNRKAMEALFAEDFSFTSPRDNHLDRDTWFARCWPGSAHMQDIELLRSVAHGDEVLATYVATTDDGRRFCNTEVLTLRDGRITAVEVYFGWSLPHPAPAGGFLPDSDEAGR